MKRPLVVMLIIGFLVSGIVGALHGYGVLLQIEQPIAGMIAHFRKISYPMSDQWQYLFIAVFGLGVAGLTLTAARRMRMALVAGGLMIELLVFAWICALHHVLFQPLPSLLAVALAFVAAERALAIATHSRATLARALFTGRLSGEQMARVIGGDMPLNTKARTYESTVVACDIANKYDLAEDTEPSAFAETTEKFIQRTTGLLLNAGGYIQAADGEGVVAIFGFPQGDAEHAEKAVRVTLDLLGSFRHSRRQNNGELFGNCEVHVGVSSGTMIVAPMSGGGNMTLLTSGEPVELARRFCVANRFYGSRVLIGPRTFELASKVVVARPIDFLSGVNTQERHEIYEPLWLAADAQPEHLARRDSFWNGVVLYREKRWAEAYSEFQKARGPDAENDAPLQLYLRRLEPLALHLAETPHG
jgi:adenylate cyclase